MRRTSPAVLFTSLIFVSALAIHVWAVDASSRPGPPVPPVFPQVLEGKIADVNASNHMFVLVTPEKDWPIRVNSRTRYSLDDRASTMEEALQNDLHAIVVHKGGVAARIAVTSARAAE